MARDNMRRRPTGAPGLGREFRDERRLVPLSDPRSPVTERYRKIKTYVEHLAERQGRQIRTLVVSSSREGEGKTLTSVNLSLVLAEDRDHSTLLIDCDLHRPAVGALLRRPPRIGLVDLFEKRAELDAVVVPLVRSRLHVLPAGSVGDVNASELIKADRFREMLDEILDRYDRVVMDAPPVMRFVDANILNEHAQGMIFVIRAGLTSRQVVRKAVASVTGGPVLGLVLNDARYTLVDRYYHRYDEYGTTYYDDE